MKKYVILLFVTTLFFTLATPQASAAGEPNLLQQTRITQTFSQTTTVSGTIVKLDAAAGSVVIKDQSGKLWEFVVTPQAGIDLSKYKVGDAVTATVTNVPTSGDKVTRARISKQELIKLQKR